MKYIKKFENTKEFTNKYKIGDYVLLNIKMIEHNNKIWGHIDTIVDKYGFIEDVLGDEEYPYLISYYNGIFIHLKENEMLRLLNQDEINDFLIKKESGKYNL